jgi:predicted TIM-barrel fold metal-dependent hydrolase
MVIDFSAYVGSFWPGREFVQGDPKTVREALAKSGFDGAFVALMEGPWYRDEQAGNKRLADIVAKQLDFFIPLACIDPTAVYCKEDVDECLDGLGMAGIKLYPQYHHYALDDPRVVALSKYMAEKKRPVFITMLIEEDRFAHPAIKVAAPQIDELTELVSGADETTFVINMARTGGMKKILKDREFGRGRIFFDTAKMDQQTIDLDGLVSSFGPERFVMGTNAPFFYPEGAVMNLAFRTIDQDAVKAILQNNYASSPVLKRIVGTERKQEKADNSPVVSLAKNDWKSMLGSFYGRIIDQHAHFTNDETLMVGMIEQAKRAGLGKILLNGLGKLDEESFSGGLGDCSAEQIISMNMAAIEWCKRYPDFLRFIAFINPRHGKAAVEHVEKWVKEHGAVGLKIHGCREDGSIDRAFPVVEKAAELGVPILFHSFFRKGGNAPAELSPLDLVEFAKASPNAILISGHFGGDWIRAARSIKPYPNIYGDTSGCTHRNGFTERAVEVIGAERIMFGVDMWARSFGTQIAKVFAANISKSEKELILFKNQERIFALN